MRAQGGWWDYYIHVYLAQVETKLIEVDDRSQPSLTLSTVVVAVGVARMRPRWLSAISP